MGAISSENLWSGVGVDVPDGDFFEPDGAFDFPTVPESMSQRPERTETVLVIVLSKPAAKINTLSETYGQVSHVGFAKIDRK